MGMIMTMMIVGGVVGVIRVVMLWRVTMGLTGVGSHGAL